MESKVITDPESILKMIDSLFKQFPVYIISEGKPRQVRIIAVKPQGVFIQSPNDNSNERSLVLTNAGNLLHFVFKINTKDPRGIEVLQPISLSIKTAVRASNRFQATSVPIRFSNFISQMMITRDLSDDDLKVETITKPYIQKLKAKYSEVSLVIHERMDAKAKLMSENNKNIFVPDYKSPDSVTENFIAYNECVPLLKLLRDSNKYFSEICIPFKFKNRFPFGYIQILNEEVCEADDYNIALLTANAINKEFMESDIFNESKYKGEVMDISATGFSFSHPQSKYFGKIFSLGGSILFDIYEEEKSLGTFKAVVRNIKPLEKLFRIGCQFFHSAGEAEIIERLILKYFPNREMTGDSQQVDVEKIRK